MSRVIDGLNAGAQALRDVIQSYRNLPPEAMSPFLLSKTAPYFGFIDVKIDNCASFAMFSNNDDFVAKTYFWNGPDAYERMSLKIWTRLARSSAIIFDIGSYTGVYSLAAAATNRKSKVYAFEALDMVYGRLLINRDANGFANINAMNVALSDKDGSTEFNVYAGDSVLSSGSSLLERNGGRPVFKKKLVRSVRLDDIVGELGVQRVDLMKIDAEGAEHLIFQGAGQILRRFKPDIVCEFLRDARISDVETMLSEMGYRYFRIDDAKRSIVASDRIVAGETESQLNTLITCKTHDQINSLLSDD